LKTRSHKKEIGIVSLGCAKNLVDSERLMRQLGNDDVKIFFDPSGNKHLDTVIINTCGFIGDAKQESIDTILQFSEAKKNGKVGRLFVMGCLSERYRQELTTDIPEVDGFYGVGELAAVVKAAGGRFRKELLGERLLTTPKHYAYLKIAEGCDRKCSFCAIPGIRGGHVSRPEKEIIREAEQLSSQGVKELLVISQDTTYYGLDLYGERRIASLARKLAGVAGIEWIRIHYAYPHGFPLDLLGVMREEEKICRYVDIPLQHISDRILRSMKRGMTGDKTRRLIDTIRARVPGVALRTTFITGYPGESPSEFRELKEFISDTGFERVGVFAYSAEEDTPAFRMKDDVPQRVKQERARELMELQENISLEINRSRIGTDIKVIVDRKEGEYYAARSEFDSPEVDNEVLIRPGHNKIVPGRFYTVRISGAGPYDLYSE
jgi:ribosomal protein S12 methylthiotransferase